MSSGWPRPAPASNVSATSCLPFTPRRTWLRSPATRWGSAPLGGVGGWGLGVGGRGLGVGGGGGGGGVAGGGGGVGGGTVAVAGRVGGGTVAGAVGRRVGA